MVIRPVRAVDAASIAEIYNYYINHTVITFEEQEVSAADIESRILDTEATNLPWLVAESEGIVAGYAYASPWKGRCAYRFSVEVTVYLAQDAGGLGLGTRLYAQLFSQLAERSYHVAIGGIALPNPASIALHEKLGMEKVAHFREVGFKFGRWVDVGYWQCQLT